MLGIEVNRDEVHFGASVTVRFMRALRVPDDGRKYPPLPSFGEFQVYAIQDYADRVPVSWRVRPGVFIPMHPHEAMWVSFSGRWWKPNAVKVGFAGFNALTGKPWHEKLAADPQDYLVWPEQNLLSGFKDEKGYFRQFVTLAAGKGSATDAEPADDEGCDGLQIMIFEPKPGLFRDHPPAKGAGMAGKRSQPSEDQSHAVTVGQEVLPDPHGIQTWDPVNFGRVCVYLVGEAVFRKITCRQLRCSPSCDSRFAKARLRHPRVSDERVRFYCE